ncbi:MAG: hypothetical protein ACRC4L_03010, partial [Mycoplasma sp.]
DLMMEKIDVTLEKLAINVCSSGWEETYLIEVLISELINLIDADYVERHYSEIKAFVDFITSQRVKQTKINDSSKNNEEDNFKYSLKDTIEFYERESEKYTTLKNMNNYQEFDNKAIQNITNLFMSNKTNLQDIAKIVKNIIKYIWVIDDFSAWKILKLDELRAMFSNLCKTIEIDVNFSRRFVELKEKIKYQEFDSLKENIELLKELDFFINQPTKNIETFIDEAGDLNKINNKDVIFYSKKTFDLIELKINSFYHLVSNYSSNFELYSKKLSESTIKSIKSFFNMEVDIKNNLPIISEDYLIPSLKLSELASSEETGLCNICVSAPFGSGKSSLLRTFMYIHKNEELKNKILEDKKMVPGANEILQNRIKIKNFFQDNSVKKVSFLKYYSQFFTSKNKKLRKNFNELFKGIEKYRTAYLRNFKYNKNYKKNIKNILNISFSDFNKESELNRGGKVDTSDLQRRIFESIIYTCKKSRIPKTRLNLIDNDKVKIFFKIISLILCSISGIFLILSVTTEPFKSDLIWLYTSLSVFTPSFIMLIALNYDKLKNMKLKFSGIQVDANTQVNKFNFFTEYLGELIYFFQQNKDIRVVFIEDLDRFEDVNIFQEIRQISISLNASKQIDREIRFIYCVRPDFFYSSEEFSKFFDSIISLPMRTHNLFIENLMKEECLKFAKSNSFLLHMDELWLLIKNTSKYIANERVLRSIFSDFGIFLQNIHFDKKDEERNTYSFIKLLSLCIYKSLYRGDYEKTSRDDFVYQNNSIALMYCDKKMALCKKHIQEFSPKFDITLLLLDLSNHGIQLPTVTDIILKIKKHYYHSMNKIKGINYFGVKIDDANSKNIELEYQQKLNKFKEIIHYIPIFNFVEIEGICTDLKLWIENHNPNNSEDIIERLNLQSIIKVCQDSLEIKNIFTKELDDQLKIFEQEKEDLKEKNNENVESKSVLKKIYHNHLMLIDKILSNLNNDNSISDKKEVDDSIWGTVLTKFKSYKAEKEPSLENRNVDVRFISKFIHNSLDVKIYRKIVLTGVEDEKIWELNSELVDFLVPLFKSNHFDVHYLRFFNLSQSHNQVSNYFSKINLSPLDYKQDFNKPLIDVNIQINASINMFYKNYSFLNCDFYHMLFLKDKINDISIDNENLKEFENFVFNQWEDQQIDMQKIEFISHCIIRCFIVLMRWNTENSKFYYSDFYENLKTKLVIYKNYNEVKQYLSENYAKIINESIIWFEKVIENKIGDKIKDTIDDVNLNIFLKKLWSTLESINPSLVK